MICPHCGRTIREEQQNLMYRDPDAEIDREKVRAVIT